MKRVNIKMIEDGHGHDVSSNGVNEPIKHYKKGEVYEVHESLAECFYQEKKAEKASSKFEEDENPEDKKKNKGLKGAPENKSKD